MFLENCDPRYSAAFVIDHNASQDIRLELDFRHGVQGESNTSRRWLSIDKGSNYVPKIMDVNLIDLKSR